MKIIYKHELAEVIDRRYRISREKMNKFLAIGNKSAAKLHKIEMETYGDLIEICLEEGWIIDNE